MDQTARVEEVTTTHAYTNVRRGTTIRFLAIWRDVGFGAPSGNLFARNPSMTVVCLRDRI
jgi:hypothetical protein